MNQILLEPKISISEERWEEIFSDPNIEYLLKDLEKKLKSKRLIKSTEESNKAYYQVQYSIVVDAMKNIVNGKGESFEKEIQNELIRMQKKLFG